MKEMVLNDTNITLKAKKLVDAASRILVFAGAGLSTESGIPDFRSPGGLWSKYDPSNFYFQNIIASEKARELYWQMSSEMWEQMRDASPNKGHLALKRLEDRGKLLAIVTQNIDHLHHKAGNHPEKIIEIHGTAVTVSCLSCKRQWPREEIHQRIRSGERVPYCQYCGGILKPDTISFGQAMPQDRLQRAFHLAAQCDLCMVLGSSLVVYPAAEIPAHASSSGARLLIINRDPTPLDSRAHVVINRPIGDVIDEIIP